MYITIYCNDAQTGQAECDVMNRTSGMNQIAEPPEADSPSAGAGSNPVKEPLVKIFEFIQFKSCM